MILNKKSLKYRLLQIMAFLGDTGLEFLFNEVAKGKRVYLGRRRYRSDYCKRLLRELTTTGYIERITKGSLSYLRLSPTAKTRLKNDIPLPYLQKKRWDGYFRGLSYDFPEKIAYKRDILREQIKTWGMGKYQRSLWITPHPLEEAINDYIQSRKIQIYALQIFTRKLSLAEGRDIAEKVWRIPQLEQEYLDFTGKWRDKLEENKLKTVDLAKLRFEYFSLIEQDPHLPLNLLPPDWPTAEARNIYLTIEKHLKTHFKTRFP